MASDRAVFLRKYLASPRSIGSVTPSSTFLAHAMVHPIDWDSLQSIVELGAGTGAFTRLINDSKQASCTAVIFEQDRDMRNDLTLKYPNLEFRSSAETLSSVLQEIGLSQVDCILSGLPFYNFSPVLRDKILNEIVQSLTPGGIFVAFQYSLQMKGLLKQFFTQVDISFVPFNLPPAFVYYCMNPVGKGGDADGHQ